MSDNKETRDNRDNNKVDINDPSEVEYVHRQFPNLKHEQILEAIKSKGPSRKAVMEYLQTKGRINSK